MRIGVISDTHGLLRPEALERLGGADHIIHAGDIGSPEIVPRLLDIAPTTAIRGNVDGGAWAHAYPEVATVALGGRTFFVLHDLAMLDFEPADRGIDVVVFGHSHRPTVEQAGGVLRLNPGSAGPRRITLPVTLATLEIGEDGGLRPQVHVLVP